MFYYDSVNAEVAGHQADSAFGGSATLACGGTLVGMTACVGLNDDGPEDDTRDFFDRFTSCHPIVSGLTD